LADYLVQKGVPFREAHEIVGRAVVYCLEHQKSLEELTIEEYQQFSPAIEEGVYQAIDIARCVEGRSVKGGPAPAAVREAISAARARLES